MARSRHLPVVLRSFRRERRSVRALAISVAPGEITQLAVTNHSAQVAQSSVDAVTRAANRRSALTSRADCAWHLGEVLGDLPCN